MAELTSKNINPGDPVTSESINNIIADLYLINKGTTVSNITLTNTTAPAVSVSSKVYSTQHKNLLVNPANTPSYEGFWIFPSKVFTKPPRCWIQINSGGAKLTETQSRMHVIVTSVSETKVTFEIRSGAGATKATIDLDIFALEA